MHTSRTARGAPQYEVVIVGPAVLSAVLGNNGWFIIRHNGRILSQSFLAEHACCTWFDILRQSDDCLLSIAEVLELSDLHTFRDWIKHLQCSRL